MRDALTMIVGLVLVVVVVVVTKHAATPASATEPDAVLVRGCIRHLEMCKKCWEAGYDPRDMAASNTPAPCMVGFYGTED